MNKTLQILGGCVLLFLFGGMIAHSIGATKHSADIRKINERLAELQSESKKIDGGLESQLAVEARSLKGAANDVLSNLEEMRQAVAALRQIQEAQARDTATTKGRIIQLEQVWTYRSPILTSAVRGIAEAVHDLEDTYPEDNPQVFGEAMNALHEGLDAWRESADSAVADKADPYQAMRNMADAVRKYEDGSMDNASFIEAQAEFLKSMELSTKRE